MLVTLTNDVCFAAELTQIMSVMVERPVEVVVKG